MVDDFNNENSSKVILCYNLNHLHIKRLAKNEFDSSLGQHAIYLFGKIKKYS